MNRLTKYSYLFILFIAVVIIAVAGYGFVQQQKEIVIEDTRHELATIADLKASQIVAWRRERLIEASSLYSNTMIARRIEEYLANDKGNKIRDELHIWMSEYVETTGYNNLMLFRPDGSLITSAPLFDGPPNPHYLLRVKSAIQSKTVLFSDLHYEASTDRLDIDLAIPIMHPENGRTRCIAVLLIDINPFRNLFPLIRSWPSPSFSGETVLVRREGSDVLFMNALRFKPDAALRYKESLSQTEMPAVQAALGREGIFDGTDYRGVHVYAALRTIPNSPWAIVTKIDRQEMLEPVAKRIWYVIGTCLIVVFACALALSLWWKRKQAVILRTQFQAEREFNRELKQAEQSLQDANANLEERVAARTDELSNSNIKLRQEIDERKQVEELLRKYFHVIQQSPIAILITDLKGRIEFVNPKFSEYCGYGYDEVIGQNPSILKTDRTPPETHKMLWQTITAGSTWEGEFCNRKKNGELYWEYAKILPIKNDQGVTTNFMGFKEDITRHKQLEKNLINARKLETIGQIAGGVAHEVRNPLNAILSITEALFREEEIGNNPEFAPYIQHIRTQVSRLANLMNDLLDLGKQISPASFLAVPLLKCCRDTVELWNTSGMAENRHCCSITFEADGTDLQVLADHDKLQQVIFNLLENAGHHTTSDSRIDLVVTSSPSDTSTVIVRIIDQGRGITEKNLLRIFDPFFSDRKWGTWLGLPLVKHFIENMGGSVRIYNNEPPPGCTAELLIPRAVKELI